MGQIIAMVNHKGGVAKTSSVSAIGCRIALMGKKVLFVDLDPQSNLTESLSQVEYDRTVYDALRERKDLPIYPLRENLDIVPSTIDLAAAEMELAGAIERESILADLLEDVAKGYDYVFLDCPPSLSLLTLNALTAASRLLVPMTAEPMPSRGLRKLLDIVKIISKRLNRGLKLDGIIITQWNNTALNRLVEEKMREVYGDIVFQTRIRKNVAIAESSASLKPIFEYSPRSNGAKDYAALTEEILERL